MQAVRHLTLLLIKRLSPSGLPDPNYFPYDTLEAKVALPHRFKPSSDELSDLGTSTLCGTRHSGGTAESRIVVPHDSEQTDRSQKIDLATALQYGTSLGLMPFRTWIRDFTRTKMHPNVPYRDGPEIVLTDGSTDGFSKTLHAFTDIWDDRKDWIRDRQGLLCEEFVYTAATSAAKPRGLNIVPITVDSEGMAVDGPGGLKDVLDNWDRSKGKRPHIMYTITVGQNPTGGLLSLERRRQVYSLCQKYDIIIVEDDPYWFLQYPSADELAQKYRAPSTSARRVPSRPSNWITTGNEFLDSLVPSYLSIDIDGRVVRLDTFSKTVAPGCRLGWITAQPAVIEIMLSVTDLQTQQPSGFVQSLIAELILGQHSSSQHNSSSSMKTVNQGEKSWQTDGWIRWLEGLRGNYERRMQVISQILEAGKYRVTSGSAAIDRRRLSTASDEFEVVSKTAMFDFEFPRGGMFLWLEVLYESHSLFGNPKTSKEKLALAFWTLLTSVSYRILVLPGTIFCPTDELSAEKGWRYLRICFAAVHEDILATLSDNFVKATNEFFDINDPAEIDKIISDNDDAANSVAGMSIDNNYLRLGPGMC